MSSRTGTIGVMMAAVAVGFFGGFLLGRARRAESLARAAYETAKAAPSRKAQDSPGTSAESSPKKELSPEDLVRLKDLIRSQRSDIERLVDDVAQARITSGTEASRKKKQDRARQIYEASLATYAGEVIPEHVYDLHRMLNEVDAEMTSTFVELYRKATAADPGAQALWTSDRRRQAWFFVFAAGGDDAARFLKEWMSDPAMSREDRAKGFEALSSIGTRDLQNLDRVPVDASLAATALDLSTSDLAGDRRGAADLLGRVSTPESLAMLRHLADTDPDSENRGVAVRSLGKIGNRETLAYLRTYPVPSDDHGGWVIRISLAESLKDLTLKFPE